MAFMRNSVASQKSLSENGIMTLAGVGAPVSGTSGTGVGIAGPMSTYTDVTNFNKYFNTGTLASPIWTQGFGTAVAGQLSGQISVANIIGVGVGQFGHANGVVLVPAPAAGKALILTEAVASYKFVVAGYTGGGNVTVNWGAGGAALTGLVSAANFAGAAADKPVLFVPLATVAIPLVAAASLNLVAAAAFTQPGTAAGVINWTVSYFIVTL